MKKLIAVALIALSLLANPVFAEETTNLDWVLINGILVYTGTDPNPQPPPPVKG
jgi:hypothetical protein